MSWSFPIAKIAGTQLRIHVTFFLLIIWVGVATYLSGGSTGAVFGVAFILTLFLCVILHEFGHVLMARRFGVETPDITLLPIGGLARLQRIPREPGKELLIAIAGPMVNVVIAAILFAILFLGEGSLDLAVDLEQHTIRGFLVSLMVVNVWLVVFNMIPAFPMDGGRVFRALLAMFLPYSRATSIAATVGQSLALAGVFFGFMYQWWLLVFVAFFIFLGAGAEASASQLQDATRGLTVSDAMITRFQFLDEKDTLSRGVDLLLDGSQVDFPLMDAEKRLIGIIHRKDLVAALRQHGEEGAVIHAKRDCDAQVHPREDLSSAIQVLRESKCSTIPVMEGDRTVGLLNAENIGEMLMVNTAIQHPHQRN